MSFGTGLHEGLWGGWGCSAIPGPEAVVPGPYGIAAFDACRRAPPDPFQFPDDDDDPLLSPPKKKPRTAAHAPVPSLLGRPAPPSSVCRRCSVAAGQCARSAAEWRWRSDNAADSNALVKRFHADLRLPPSEAMDLSQRRLHPSPHVWGMGMARGGVWGLGVRPSQPYT